MMPFGSCSDIMSLAILELRNGEQIDSLGQHNVYGIPMGYGGPHAAYFATKDEYKRNIQVEL